MRMNLIKMIELKVKSLRSLQTSRRCLQILNFREDCRYYLVLSVLLSVLLTLALSFTLALAGLSVSLLSSLSSSFNVPITNNVWFIDSDSAKTIFWGDNITTNDDITTVSKSWLTMWSGSSGDDKGD